MSIVRISETENISNLETVTADSVNLLDADLVNIEIRLFGAFRKYLSCQGEAQKSFNDHTVKYPNSLVLSVNKNILLKDLRNQLITKLNSLRPDLDSYSLVFDSAFANEDSILEDHQCVGDRPFLSILPPVCGG